MILFVYVLIGVSQIVLRRRSGSESLRVKMWLFPALSIFTVLAIVAILVQMGVDRDSRSRRILSLLSWAVVIAFYFANKWYIARRPVPEGLAPAVEPRRVLVLANETANSEELLTELRRIGADRAANYFVAVPASPVETGTAAKHGPLDLMAATQEAARSRLEHTLSILRAENLQADGALGDHRPRRALADAVGTFHPDQIVIATLPLESSVWHRFDVVDRARTEHPDVPVIHVEATPTSAGQTV